MTLESLNALTSSEAMKQFELCCGSSGWVRKMEKNRPFNSIKNLFQKAKSIWFSLSIDDWSEAFLHHPKIGNMDSLPNQFQNTKSLSINEQSGITVATETTLIKLAESNQLYEDKFGFIFIVCATGKSAKEMLELLKTRLENNLETELQNAAIEQNKITQIRLQKLLL